MIDFGSFCFEIFCKAYLLSCIIMLADLCFFLEKTKSRLILSSSLFIIIVPIANTLLALLVLHEWFCFIMFEIKRRFLDKF